MEVNFFGWNLCLFNRMESSNPVHKTPTYIVYENCLLELFEVCPVCRRVTDVQTRRVGTFLSVEQKCPHCQFYRKWNSQPLLGSTPVGNIQLSAAVYATGASFFKLEKVIVNWLYLNSQHNSLVVINWTWNIIIWIFWSEIIYIYICVHLYLHTIPKAVLKSPVSFLTSDIPGNAVEDVSVWHISKARPDVHRACNRTQLENSAGWHVGPVMPATESHSRWWLEGWLTRYVILTVTFPWKCLCLD